MESSTEGNGITTQRSYGAEESLTHPVSERHVMVGQYLRNKRMRSDYSLERLSRYLDHSPNYLSRVEDGEEAADPLLLSNWTQEIGADLDAVLCMLGYDRPGVVPHEYSIALGRVARANDPHAPQRKYSIVTDIREAAALSGLSPDDILTVEDIQEKYGFKACTIRRWSSNEESSLPVLCALPIRRRKSGPGGGKLLFSRSDVETFKLSRRGRKPKKK